MLKRTSKQLSMFSSLEDMLSHEHPLFQLSNKINWKRFENAFSPLYCSTNGRPAHPIRLMCGLLILKHLRNVSDEMVVSQWSENAYYQYCVSSIVYLFCSFQMQREEKYGLTHFFRHYLANFFARGKLYCKCTSILNTTIIFNSLLKFR